MMTQSALCRARVIDCQEASDEEAFEFLQYRLGEDDCNKNKKDLVVLVKNYSGGKFNIFVGF